MSHDATNWAIKQRGLKPAAKVVLWHLCDRYHPDHGCFPSQDTLADDCELSRSSLNDQLSVLENAGLIARERRRRKGTAQQETTVYRFAFEPGFAPVSAEKPSPNSGLGEECEAVSENGGEPCPKIDESRVRNSDRIPVREPVIEPVTEREGESASEIGDQDRKAEAGDVAKNRRSALKAFDRWYRSWPARESSHDAAQEAWFALSDEQRAACIDRTTDYIDWVGGAKKISTWAAVYLRERRWEMLPPKVSSMAPSEMAKPFGKAGMAYRLYILTLPEKPHPTPTALLRQIIQAGGDRAIDEIISRRAAYSWPKLSELERRIGDRQLIRVAPEIAALGSDFISVELAGPVGQAWKRLFRRERLPWLLPAHLNYACFPPIAADEQDLDEAVAAAFWAFKERIEGHVHVAAE